MLLDDLAKVIAHNLMHYIMSNPHNMAALTLLKSKTWIHQTTLTIHISCRLNIKLSWWSVYTVYSTS